MTVQQYAVNHASGHIGRRLVPMLRDIRTGEEHPWLRHEVSRLDVVPKRGIGMERLHVFIEI